MSYEKQIYDRAEAELNQRRFNAENEQRIRMAAVEKEIPEIREIYSRLSQTIVEISKLIISKSGDFKENFNRIKEQNLQGQQLAETLLTSHGYPADYLSTKYTCQICNDRGFVNGERCSCFTRLLNKYSIDKLNESANMPQCDFEHFSLDFSRGITAVNGQDCYEIMSQVYDFCTNYAKRFSLKSESLFMYGQTGVGKTHLSLAIAKEAAEKGYTVAYGSLINYLTIKRAFRKGRRLWFGHNGVADKY